MAKTNLSPHSSVTRQGKRGHKSLFRILVILVLSAPFLFITASYRGRIDNATSIQLTTSQAQTTTQQHNFEGLGVSAGLPSSTNKDATKTASVATEADWATDKHDAVDPSARVALQTAALPRRVGPKDPGASVTISSQQRPRVSDPVHQRQEPIRPEPSVSFSIKLDASTLSQDQGQPRASDPSSGLQERPYDSQQGQQRPQPQLSTQPHDQPQGHESAENAAFTSSFSHKETGEPMRGDPSLQEAAQHSGAATSFDLHVAISNTGAEPQPTTQPTSKERGADSDDTRGVELRRDAGTATAGDGVQHGLTDRERQDRDHPVTTGSNENQKAFAFADHQRSETTTSTADSSANTGYRFSARESSSHDEHHSGEMASSRAQERGAGGSYDPAAMVHEKLAGRPIYQGDKYNVALNQFCRNEDRRYLFRVQGCKVISPKPVLNPRARSALLLFNAIVKKHCTVFAATDFSFCFINSPQPPEALGSSGLSLPVVSVVSDPKSWWAVPFPDFTFWSGPTDVRGTGDGAFARAYAYLTKQAAQQRYEGRDPRIYWSGDPSLSTGPGGREAFHALSQSDPARWSFKAAATGGKTEPVEELPKYKFYLDVRGIGYTPRLKFSFLAGSTVLHVDRPFAEYWFDYFRAYEHFVPIQADASDFARQVQWMDENPAQCEAMARRAFERAAEVLGPDRVLSDARWMLVTFMRAVGYEPPTPTLAQLTAEEFNRSEDPMYATTATSSSEDGEDGFEMAASEEVAIAAVVSAATADATSDHVDEGHSFMDSETEPQNGAQQQHHQQQEHQQEAQQQQQQHQQQQQEHQQEAQQQQEQVQQLQQDERNEQQQHEHAQLAAQREARQAAQHAHEGGADSHDLAGFRTEPGKASTRAQAEEDLSLSETEKEGDEQAHDFFGNMADAEKKGANADVDPLQADEESEMDGLNALIKSGEAEQRAAEEEQRKQEQQKAAEAERLRQEQEQQRIAQEQAAAAAAAAITGHPRTRRRWKRRVYTAEEAAAAIVTATVTPTETASASATTGTSAAASASTANASSTSSDVSASATEAVTDSEFSKMLAYEQADTEGGFSSMLI